MSLALRGVARRAEQHADEMTGARGPHESISRSAAGTCCSRSRSLRERAPGATADEAPAIQADCDECTRSVPRLDADVDDLGHRH